METYKTRSLLWRQQFVSLTAHPQPQPRFILSHHIQSPTNSYITIMNRASIFSVLLLLFSGVISSPIPRPTPVRPLCFDIQLPYPHEPSPSSDHCSLLHICFFIRFQTTNAGERTTPLWSWWSILSLTLRWSHTTAILESRPCRQGRLPHLYLQPASMKWDHVDLMTWH